MQTFLMVVLAIASIILIGSILMQSSNSAGLSGSIGGGAEQLFGKKKGRGEMRLHRTLSGSTGLKQKKKTLLKVWRPEVLKWNRENTPRMLCM